jgi:hypothetical protein
MAASTNPQSTMAQALGLETEFLKFIKSNAGDENTNVYTYLQNQGNTIGTDGTTLTNNAGNLSSALSALTTNEYNILTQQQNTDRILNRELARLKDKKSSIDTIIQGQNRMTLLNESYNARSRAYIGVITTILFIFVGMLAIFQLKRSTTYIADEVASLFYIVWISAGAIYLSYQLWDIYRRDNINFNKLSQSMMKTPKDLSGNEAVDENGRPLIKGQVNLLDAVGSLCVGSSCCSTGMHYDVVNGKCIDNCPTGTDWNEEQSTCVSSTSGSTTAAFVTMASDGRGPQANSQFSRGSGGLSTPSGAIASFVVPDQVLDLDNKASTLEFTPFGAAC